MITNIQALKQVPSNSAVRNDSEGMLYIPESTSSLICEDVQQQNTSKIQFCRPGPAKQNLQRITQESSQAHNPGAQPRAQPETHNLAA